MGNIGNATYVKRGEGEALWVLGSLFDVRAGGAETGGALTAVEMTFAPKQIAAPPHRHDCGEVAYVIEGQARYHIGEQAVDVRPGDFLYFPQGTLEWVENTTDQPCRALVLYLKPGIEKFFAEVGERATSRTLPPPLTAPPDIAKLAEAAKRHGLEILKPPAR